MMGGLKLNWESLKLVMEMMKLRLTLMEAKGSTDKVGLVVEGIEIRTKSNQPVL